MGKVAIDESKSLIPIAELLPAEYTETIPELVVYMRDGLQAARAAVAAFPAVIETEEQKTEAFNLREKFRIALKEINGERMPFTRALDLITKEFTTGEKGFQECIDEMDKRTSAFATLQLAEQRRKQKERDIELAKDKTKIELEGNTKILLQQRVSEFLDAVRAAAGKVVGEVTKATLKECQDRLSVTPKWTEKMNTKFFMVPEDLTDQELMDKFLEIVEAEKPAMMKHYQERGKLILADSKSILEVALTNKEEAQRLSTAATQNQKTEENQTIAEIQANTDGKLAMAGLDAMADVPNANVRTKWLIDQSKIKRAGWLKLVAFFFEFDQEKKDDLSKKTFMQCLKFAEEMANADTPKKLDHPEIVYIEDVKARKG